MYSAIGWDVPWCQERCSYHRGSNKTVGEKMEEASAMIKRENVFAASLYTQWNLFRRKLQDYSINRKLKYDRTQHNYGACWTCASQLRQIELNWTPWRPYPGSQQGQLVGTGPRNHTQVNSGLAKVSWWTRCLYVALLANFCLPGFCTFFVRSRLTSHRNYWILMQCVDFRKKKRQQ